MRTLFGKITLVFCFASSTLLGQSDSTKTRKLDITTEHGISELHSMYTSQSKKKLSTEGYRVQIYNGQKKETLNARREFMGVFPNVPVYTVYESPEYKVQVGDFRTRLEAEKFLNSVVEQYGSGFVTKTTIKFPKL